MFANRPFLHEVRPPEGWSILDSLQLPRRYSRSSAAPKAHLDVGVIVWDQRERNESDLNGLPAYPRAKSCRTPVRGN